MRGEVGCWEIRDEQYFNIQVGNWLQSNMFRGSKILVFGQRFSNRYLIFDRILMLEERVEVFIERLEVLEERVEELEERLVDY